MEQGLKDLWSESAEYRQRYQTNDDLQDIVQSLALDNARGLVDIGCGNGAFAILAARTFPRCRVWAFDALESAISECLAAGDLLANNLRADVAWAHALPLPDAVADRALCRSVLHHIGEPDAVYGEIARVLEPGGRLVLQAPCNFWEPEFEQVLGGLMMLIDDSHPRFYYGPADVAAGLERAGFGTSQPQCWTYEFPFLGEREVEFVRQHHAEDRLRLRAIEPGKWSIDNYWVRITATKGNV